MPYEVFLALRYVRSRHKRRLARTTALVAVLGIGLGVASLIVAFALSNGFRDEMRDKILQGTAHISVLRSDSLALNDYEEVSRRVRQVAGVASASATTYDGAVVLGVKGSAYAVLRGVEKDATDVLPRQWLQEGSFTPLFSQERLVQPTIPQVVIGLELAKRAGLKVGDVFQVVVPGEGQSSPNASTRRLRVCGIFRSGLYEYDSTWIYLSLDTATAFASASHVASVVSVQVNNADNVKRIASDIRAVLGPGYTTVDWQEANQPLFAALSIERRMGLLIIGLIIAIAALNITTMLILVVVERRRDIAILGALGAGSHEIMLLFVIEGAVVGAMGAIAGVLLGLFACFIGNYFHLVSLPADVYSISNVPLNTHWTEVLIAALVAFLLSVVATIYPARSAAQMRPVDAIREG